MQMTEDEKEEIINGRIKCKNCKFLTYSGYCNHKDEVRGYRPMEPDRYWRCKNHFNKNKEFKEPEIKKYKLSEIAEKYIKEIKDKLK